MLAPAPVTQPICPMCGEPGIHGTEQKCIEALKAAVVKLKQRFAQLPVDPSILYLDRYVPSFYP